MAQLCAKEPLHKVFLPGMPGSALPDPALFLRSIAEISKAVMERTYVEDILALIVSVTAKVTGSSICSILLLDRRTNELVLRACQTDRGSYHQRSNTPLGKGIAGRVALRNEPIAVADVRKDPRYLNKKVAVKDGLVSLLSVPMSAEGVVIGVINCYTPQPHEFTDEEVQMLTTVASQAAVLLQNTELRIMKEIVEKELAERKLIERAKEILMHKKRISGTQAFSLMRKRSMDSRVSMARLAESIITAAAFD
ncbi:MAG: GAF domain-containing protein [Chitinivibrionales bacterium]|nr:GAF domain-containing protein [Chitinivibrionales bacterium]